MHKSNEGHDGGQWQGWIESVKRMYACVGVDVEWRGHVSVSVCQFSRQS